jgi:predicted AAA+ superfamily ATPase
MVDFKSIVKEQREELDRIMTRENIIDREALIGAQKYLSYPNVLVITGIRRCGKSIFSYLLDKGKIFGYINFDDERLSNMLAAELDLLLSAVYELYGEVEYIILDEIQNIKGWELFVNRLRRTKKVIVTGSNSNLLSSELATHLTGRHIDIKLFPFSFKEFLLYKKFSLSNAYTTKEKAGLLQLLEEYITLGGMPESYKFGNQILVGIYEDIITKDILLQHHISKNVEFKNLARYLITNSGTEISYSKMGEMLNIGHVSTVSNWTSYLENAFLFFKVDRFDFKLKKQYLSNKKFYCIDTGLINSIGFKFSENKGRLMENLVAIELQRRKISDNIEAYFWKDTVNKEVDFIIKKDTKITELIQVTYANSKIEIKDREIESLQKAGKELKCSNKTIITWNYEAEIENIQYVPLWKWLTEKR